MPDPAAAPLGTDAEAGGAPPTAEERAIADRQTSAATAAEPRPPLGIAVYLSIIGAVAVVLVALVALAAS